MRFEGKVVIVTGGATGIGAAATRRFREEGAEVVVVDIDEAAARASHPSGVTVVAGDVADERVCQEAIAVHGRVDVMLANAGGGIDAGVMELGLADWNRGIGVNLTGGFLAAHAAFLRMVDQGGGSIVITSSPHGLRTVAHGDVAYATAKAGLLGLTRALAMEGVEHGVRVNAVLPGAIDTPLVRNWVAKQPDPETALAGIVANSPRGSLGRPEEVAAAILFLASDEASFITGASLAVDGGLLARL